GGDQEGLDTHVQQAMQRSRGIGRVQRREYEVPGQRGLYGDPCGLDVAHLADQDDVRVLPQDGPQPTGEGDTGRLVDLDLVDRVEGVLHRVLDRHDVALRAVDLAE